MIQEFVEQCKYFYQLNPWSAGATLASSVYVTQVIISSILDREYVKAIIGALLFGVIIFVYYAIGLVPIADWIDAISKKDGLESVYYFVCLSAVDAAFRWLRLYNRPDLQKQEEQAEGDGDRWFCSSSFIVKKSAVRTRWLVFS